MNIAVRLFLGYFLIVGLAAWFLVSIFSREVEPGVRQATEETLVDTANLLAEIVADDLRAGRLANGTFAAAVDRALARRPQALISGVAKNSVDARVYVTDATGRVVFDSAGLALGADYSQWRDVARVLRGEYGARSTREDPADPQTSVMYVAAPVFDQGRLIGVLSVSKPGTSLMPYADRARDRFLKAGLLLLALSALIGLAFTGWLTWSLNRLRDFALAVAAGRKVEPPVTGGRQLSVLARSLVLMREKLDGKQYVESYVQSLAHELKSPLTAVRGSAELLQDATEPEDRLRFTRHVLEQSERLQLIIDRLLALARVEQLQAPEARRDCDLDVLLRNAAKTRAEAFAAAGLGVVIESPPGARLVGDPFLLEQAIGNLLDNAIDFAPAGSTVTLKLAEREREGRRFHELSVGDQGPGAPDYALPHLFERFYSLPRPATGRKSTGLGLPFVMEVAKLHGGTAEFTNRPEGGATARLCLAAGAR